MRWSRPLRCHDAKKPRCTRGASGLPPFLSGSSLECGTIQACGVRVHSRVTYICGMTYKRTRQPAVQDRNTPADHSRGWPSSRCPGRRSESCPARTPRPPSCPRMVHGTPAARHRKALRYCAVGVAGTDNLIVCNRMRSGIGRYRHHRAPNDECTVSAMAYSVTDARRSTFTSSSDLGLQSSKWSLRVHLYGSQTVECKRFPR